jgi:hypothetical protein
MPRFHFDTNIHGELHLDEEGAEYPDVSSAVHAAKSGAAEYLADKIAHGRSPDDEEKIVRAEDGKIVAPFMIYDAFGGPIPHD